MCSKEISLEVRLRIFKSLIAPIFLYNSEWFGNLQRLPKEAPTKIAYEEVTTKPVKKVRGGQPLAWHKTIEKET